MKSIFRYTFLVLIFLQYPAYSQSFRELTRWVNYEKYAEANKSLPALTPGENRVVFMGNSITEFWAKRDSSFFIDNGYIDRGISGQVSAQMLLRFRQDVIDLKPTVVVILAGTNDIAENAGPISLQRIMDNIVSMTQLAQVNNIKVILCSVLPAYDFPWHKGLQPAEKIVKLNSMIKSYCDENNIPYVDYYSKMVDNQKGLQPKLTVDGVHPDHEGYRVMDSIVQETLKAVLKQK